MFARHHDCQTEYQAHARAAEELVTDVVARVSTVLVMIAAAFLGATF